ncbi:rRNA biogenesis protein rrp5 [Pleurostoma richardsiae]|uniref:rRNA biogenesis protein RRP5 n=1 Tax=Pleurostoma richardsiae TaxID=41990 RepID=A0AA38RC35_9PEZI|nr:rRNA biogenesis protein rrp5 [Pleurostoma richardsiae]
MSSLKRKDGPGTGATNKGAKATSDNRPNKRAKSDKPGNNVKTKPKAKTESTKSSNEPKSAPAIIPDTAPVISKLKEEEPLFPRGGGSVLSPLEQKQITIQAKQDALFEESHPGSKGSDAAAKKKRRKSSGKEDQDSIKLVRDEDAVRIESLNYKRLVKGSLVLGQVSEINDLDVAIALPNNLVGHVSITAISDSLTKRVEAVAAADESSEDDESVDSDDDVDLKTLFSIGQYVRAYVVSTIEDSEGTVGKPKKHIELSLRPEDANSGLSAGDIVEDVTVMAAVSSVEDHGYVMDVGIAGSSSRGFLAKKEVDAEVHEGTLQPGAVLLCLVSGKSANGKIVQLTASRKKLASLKHHAATATTINAFLPGTAVEVLVTEVSKRGIVGKVLGHLDVTADLVHSGLGPDGTDLEETYKVGSKFKARVICTFPEAEKPKLGISVLPHITSLSPKSIYRDGENRSPLEVLPISSIVDRCTVRKVQDDVGLFVDLGSEGISGFVHISRVKDGKIEALYEDSGPYKVGSVHRGRVVGYNAVDGVFLLSFEQHVLEQPFLRVEDVPVGEVVNGTVEKLLVGEHGVSGLIIRLAEHVSGLVPETHMSDVRLQHPEKKFKEGLKIKARVLSTDPVKRQIRLTLKKTLVNSDAPTIKSFDDVSTGMQVPGTIVNIMQTGAIIQFYGSLRGFLPISEMSEAYIKDPNEHFRLGQVVNVHILDVDAEANRLIVSCKDPSAFGMDKQVALKNIKLGDIVSAKVTQKTEDDVFLELEGSSLKAMLPVGHLTDKSTSKNQSAWKRIHVGQALNELVVLDKHDAKRSIVLSQKPSLVKAAQEGKLLTSLDSAAIGDLVQGFVRNITPTAVFVQFTGRVTALLPKSMMSQEQQSQENFGLQKLRPLQVKVVSVDTEQGRLVVAMPSVERKPSAAAKPAENPIDGSISSLEDITIGRITKAKITAVKETQLNVALADNVQGRIDVSAVFDSWDEIADPKKPLKQFRQNQIVDVRILGGHDAKNHRFLPISHRSTHTLLELSAKPSDLRADVLPEPLSLEAVKVGSTYVGFVNNVKSNCLWVNLSPTVRGRINAMEASDDLSLLGNLAASFPVGSALRLRVLAVDASQGHLDLSARSSSSSHQLTWDDIKEGLVLPGKVTKVNDRQVMIKLGDTVAGPVHLVDISDDFDTASTKKYSKNDIVRVSVVAVDKSNKKVRLSTRPSRVLNSALPVKDREITAVSSVKAGDIVRGFVKNVADSGLFINLGGDVTGYVKISDLSDTYLKDWKSHFQIDQLVKGRVTQVDPTVNHIQMSLRPSVVDKEYVPLLTIADFKEGQVVTGKIRSVMEFGAFIVIDKSANVSGLCHRSEMADKPVSDARKLYDEGDVVKARILKIEKDKKKISFGLKASYFDDNDDEMDVDDEDAGAALLSDSDDESIGDEDVEDADDDIVITGTDNFQDDESDEDDDEDVAMANQPTAASGGLEAGGFDWSAGALDDGDNLSQNGDAVVDSAEKRKKKKRKPEIQVDRTGELDAHGPQTASDYERLLLGEPDSSALWIAYMAFQMQVSELSKARETAERAIKTINIREETEKLNMWIAYLNLENAYGTDETTEEVFKRACQYNDEQEVYERLTSIYIQSGKHQKADELFQALVKKFGAKSPQVWTNYAHFLHNTLAAPERARALLPRAMQMLDQHTHVPLTTKFAALEFRSPNGSPERGRTLFEGLLDTFPKKFDLWNQLLDLEIAVHKAARKEAGGAADPAAVRDVFERGTKVKGLKPRRAKAWFQRWAKWEEENGDAKTRERVSIRAREWASQAEARKKAAEAGEDDEE